NGEGGGQSHECLPLSLPRPPGDPIGRRRGRQMVAGRPGRLGVPFFSSYNITIVPPPNRRASPMTSRRLAQLVVQPRWEEVPEAARHEARRSLLNVVGTALGGSGDAASRRAAATLAPFSGPAEATVIGRRERVDCLTASFLNALAGNVFDFDDTHPETIIHP